MKTFNTVDFNKTLADEYMSILAKNAITISDFLLISLACWDSDGSTEISFEDDLILIKLKDYVSQQTIYTVAGNQYKCANLIEQYITEDKTKVFKFLDEAIAKKVNTEKFSVVKDRDSFEYIYDLKKFTEMSGDNYTSLRKHISKFIRNHPSSEVKPLDLKDYSTQAKIINLTKTWTILKGFSIIEQEKDLASITKYISISHLFSTKNYGLFINDDLIGYSFNEIMYDKTVNGQFGRTDNNYRYSSNYLEHAVAKLLFSEGYEYLNMQQDAGLEGLRTLKLMYNPDRMLEKYIIQNI